MILRLSVQVRSLLLHPPPFLTINLNIMKFWLIALYLASVALSLIFNRGAHRKREPNEMHEEHRYQVAEDIKKQNIH